MLFNLRVFLLSIVAELEYLLYPWKEEKPPEVSYDQNLHYDWVKSNGEKIARLQEEMIWVQKEIHKLHIELKTHD